MSYRKCKIRCICITEEKNKQACLKWNFVVLFNEYSLAILFEGRLLSAPEELSCNFQTCCSNCYLVHFLWNYAGIHWLGANIGSSNGSMPSSCHPLEWKVRRLRLWKPLVQGYLIKLKNTIFNRSKDKAEKSYGVLRHLQLHMSKYKKNEDLQSTMSNLQPNCCL